MTKWRVIGVALGTTILVGGILLAMASPLSLLTGVLPGLLAGYLPKQGVKSGLWHGCVAATGVLVLGGVLVGVTFARAQTAGYVSSAVGEAILVTLLFTGLVAAECIVASGVGGLISKVRAR